ncbi:MAG TPA: hypothetical protein VM370_04695 [Candidatus Thermoplasmatota archaeon]|nr:hypothetical protein [Candidatus Thermoplasmatota archaeon]
MRLGVAALALLLLLPSAAASHVTAGADCGPAAAYLARVDARIVAARAEYNATNAQLSAAKAERDDLAEELVDGGGPVDDLTDAVSDALTGGGSKLADVIADTLDAIDDGNLNDDGAQAAFFATFDQLYGLSQDDAESVIDPDDKEDQLADLLDAAEDARGAILGVLDERAGAASSKRALDALGAELRALAAEDGSVRALCRIPGVPPTVPQSEPALGSPDGPSDTDLLDTLFAVETMRAQILDVQDDYLTEVLEVLDPLLDSTPDDVEDALDDAGDALDDLADPIDRAIDLHLGILDTLEMDAPTDEALVADREDDTATTAERTSAMDEASVVGAVLRTNAALARTTTAAARTSLGHEVRFALPSGTPWPTSIVVVGAGADPAQPLATLASNGTTRLFAASYDVYAMEGNERHLLRAGVAVGASNATVDAAGAVRITGATDAPASARWGVVRAGGVAGATAFEASVANTTVLAAPGAHEVYLRLPGRFETFVANVTIVPGGVREVALPERCTATADAIVLDVDGDGLALNGSTRTRLLGAANATLRWTMADTDDALLALDATALASAGTTLLSAVGEPLAGTTLARGGLLVRTADGDPTGVVDAPALAAVLDANGDGRLTASDPAWGALRLWTDADGDGAIDTAEMRDPAALAGVSTSFGNASRDAVGNVVRAGTFTRGNESTAAALADVLFADPARCGNPALPAPPTPSPTPATPTPSPTSPTQPTATPEPATPSPAPPTGDVVPTVVLPTGAPSVVPPPTASAAVEPQGPIPGPGVALVVAAAGAALVLAGRRRR